MKNKLILTFLSFLLAFSFEAAAQKKKKGNQTKPEEISLEAFKLRNVGPAFLSGRIADIALHPDNNNIWYVAVGSGGVWKTENAGTTWKPLFDSQDVYSTGCITIDSNNPNVIWVGTGENVGGRHVGFGDGVYKSEDGGKSWKNMGLKKSEHISKIIIDPNNSDNIWVAAQGPLWSKGGERGLYKSTDGGKNWKRTLGNNEWTGVTDMLQDPSSPNIMYAATWDRHRTVAAYMGGGPGTAIYKSTDYGDTWEKLTKGLPTSNMGKIGLALSPQKNNVIYAAIELDRRKGGVYRSSDFGASWVKMSDTVSGATGPHYYQELYASPFEFDKIYLMDVRIQVSDNGGKTFKRLNESDKHSDNHVMVFKKDDPGYLMVGTDAGIYESFDDAKTWKYIKNLPLTQFYKVAVNNRYPFYEIFGGTQDNGSVGGPSATDEREGIANKHWQKTLFADGHQSATDPENDDIVYAETQQGRLFRVDLVTGDKVFIQPQASEGEPHERFNWDSPILVSPHDPATLYFASYRVWKSTDRGNNWEPISGDLTRNENRIELPILGKKQSWDNPWDIYAMSTYNTISSLSESPIKEGVIYAGTDDGFIFVTDNGGKNWKKIPVTQLGLPERTFVNDIKADLYDENTVYVALDNHKEGDYKSYLFKSTDKGTTWQKMSSNLPPKTLVWRIVQDFKDKDLFFIGTEFGIYLTLNGGKSWQKLPGSPTISFRDLVIQKRESDLIGASFGRGFFVLDDYSPLRNFTPEMLKQEVGSFFKPREAKWYIPKSIIGNTGADYYFAENPKYGAVFTYYLNQDFKTLKQKRQEKEKELSKKNQNINFPGWDKLEDEETEFTPKVVLTIYNSKDELIRKVEQKASKGSHRIAWKLDFPNPFAISKRSKADAKGALVPPGEYSATLSLVEENKVTPIGEKVDFKVTPIHKSTLGSMDVEKYTAFLDKITALVHKTDELENNLSTDKKKVSLLKKALSRSNLPVGQDEMELNQIEKEIRKLENQIGENHIRGEVGEKSPNTLSTFLYAAYRSTNSINGPTGQHEKSLENAESKYNAIKDGVKAISTKLNAMEEKLKKHNAPPLVVN